MCAWNWFVANRGRHFTDICYWLSVVCLQGPVEASPSQAFEAKL